MTTLSFRDAELLSAYLDGQLSRAEYTRLNARLASEPDLAAALEEIRRTSALLRRAPRRRAPRNFTLTPKMAGIRPPLPRAVPTLRWASVVALLLLFFTFAGNLIAPMSPTSKMAAPAVGGYGGGPVPESATPAESIVAGEPTPPPPTAPTLLVSEPTTQPADLNPELLLQPEPGLKNEPTRPAFTLTPLQIILIALVLTFGGAAYLVGWLTERTFQRKIRR